MGRGRRHHAPRNHYIPDPYSRCAICGFKYHFSELKLQYDGLYVCKYEWEPLPYIFKDFPTYPHEGQPIPGAMPDLGFNFVDPSVPSPIPD